MLPSLSHELTLEVGHHLPPSDLCLLACTSSEMCALAQCILYKNVVISSPTIDHIVELSTKPHLACQVRSFRFLGLEPGVLHSKHITALKVALSYMLPGLISISLMVPEHMSHVLGPSMDYKAMFPTLLHFEATFSLDAQVTQFLEKTPGLEALALHGYHGYHSVQPPDPGFLPNLSAFSGPVHVAEVLVPGRPISKITLTSGVLTLSTVSALSETTAAVTYLDAETELLPDLILGPLALATPGLEYLRLLSNDENISQKSGDWGYLEVLKSRLSEMRHLKCVQIAQMAWKWEMEEGKDGCMVRVLRKEPFKPVPMSPQTLDDKTDYLDGNWMWGQ